MATDPEDIIPERDVSFYSNSSTSDYWLFHQSNAIAYYGIGVPVVACVGFVMNIFTFSAYQHPDFRCLSTLFLNANLVTDSVLLLSSACLVAPKYWLHKFFENLDYSHFWRALRAAQTTHIVAYPVFMITKCLSQWYTMALVIEQWFVFAYPGKLSKMRSREQGHKMVVLIMNLTIIVHFVVFFKYTRQKVFIWQNSTVPVRTEADEICLSYAYRSISYQRYEKYIYFIIFELAPCSVTFLFSILCFVENHRLNKELLKKDTDITNMNLLRTFRSGRSVSTVLSIGVAFSCLQLTAHIIYILSLADFNENWTLDTHCYLTPYAKLFRRGHPKFGIVYTYVNLTNSAIKPWICLSFNPDFRQLLRTCCSWQERIFTIRTNEMTATAFDSSFPNPDESLQISCEDRDDANSTTSTNYFDAISYSTVGTPMLWRTDTQKYFQYDDTLDHPKYPIEIELVPMDVPQDDSTRDHDYIDRTYLQIRNVAMWRQGSPAFSRRSLSWVHKT
ncbi:hypothetical protein CAPTEDRAFT_212000 [Capitella teleta]|uniref:G-protein coupled receptors family 1 profile domain-containing protein n=1 Tax=Capitella teleta TaxID=283909 RepID=R7V9V7_CAPTE|nr:hypothetical protein CAPTEDRAFT_212000 [Capitella teleta]|eukprot:ELU12525.1 hypothetical protein CAPTEDRAFT_212000 [Capitella teleta]